jgi:flagellar basal-body rod protein FlgB
MNFIDSIYDYNLKGLEKILDLTNRRQKVINANVANAETPHYRAVDLNFAGELERTFSKKNSQDLLVTNKKHLSTTNDGNAFIFSDLSGVTKADGNNVDIDLQMARQRYNAGQYNYAAEVIRHKFQQIKSIIRESA